MATDHAGARARIETALADKIAPDPGDIGVLLSERDQLAHDLRCERYGRRLAETRIRDLDAETTVMRRQRDQIRAVVSANGYNTVGTEAAGFAAGRGYVNRQITAILDQETP